MGPSDDYPQRIVCLSDETTETLYLLGEDERLVGISGTTVRPPQARRDKPVVSSFVTAKVDDIQQLEPDLVLAFSDLQADIARDLVACGIEVHIFNQRTVSGILRMIRTVGRLLGREPESEQLNARLIAGLNQLQREAGDGLQRPRVYFEEWHDPLITGIGWVSELIFIAGGEDCFSELACQPLAKQRIINDPDEVVRRAPEIILASWCGRPFDRQEMLSRSGWQKIPAVRDEQVFEIDSSILLQPGPAALTDGVQQLQQIFSAWRQGLPMGDSPHGTRLAQ